MRRILLIATVTAVTHLASAQATLELRAPRGLSRPVPGSATFQPAVAALGRTLFFDKNLSIDRRTACSSCHLPKHGFANNEALPQGSLGKRALRNAPTLFNRAYGKVFGWVGKAKSLEEQVILPISDPNEMALPLEKALLRLRDDKQYAQQFQSVFGKPATAEDVSAALAAYVRTLVHGDTVIDQFRAGLGGEITREERAGLWVFESKGGCWKCHNGGNFSDEKFHNTGVGARNGEPRPGRMAITKNAKDRGGFKTPTLRALAQTAPYMHDGSIATLEGVVDFYRRGGNKNEKLDNRMKPLQLTDEEARHLVAFLRALSRHAAKRNGSSAKKNAAGDRPGDPRRK